MRGFTQPHACQHRSIEYFIGAGGVFRCLAEGECWSFFDSLKPVEIFFFLQLAHDPTYPTAGNTVTALALSVPQSLVVM